MICSSGVVFGMPLKTEPTRQNPRRSIPIPEIFYIFFLRPAGNKTAGQRVFIHWTTTMGKYLGDDDDNDDKAAQFEAMALPHLDAAYNLARWLTRDPHDADD